MAKTVRVIGGGLGGLSAAIRLAKMGFDVSLYEKNQSFGGKMNEIRLGEFRFDTGPSLITMPFVIQELFDFAGYNTRDMIEFVKTEPICRYFFPDGTVFDASSDMDTMLAEIEKISPSDVKAYRRFMDYSKRIYNLTADIFLFSALHEPSQLLQWRNLLPLLQVWRIDPFRSVHKAVSSFFQDKRLVQIFDRYATYNGSDPFQAPATLNIIPWVEYGIGGYSIKGGLYRLIDAMVQIALKLGVTLYNNAPVDKILHRNGRVNGIQVQGEEFPADFLVCNADVVYALNNLIDKFPNITRKMNRLGPSLSGLVYLWGMKSEQLMFKHHNIIFSSHYEKEFKQMFAELEAPDDPTIYLSMPSKSAFVLLNMPYLNNQNWDDIIKIKREQILTKFQQLGMDTQSLIQEEKVITPRDFYEQYFSNRGSIYGISSNSRSMAYKRPANRARFLKGLYFAGGSVHPGGGVPLAILSGKLAAELISRVES